METVVIRALRAEDAEVVAALNGALGYPASADQVLSRIAAFRDDNERMARVAVRQNTVVGWVAAEVERRLQSEAAVVIAGLVVREDMRGQGVGQRLCQAVEAWTAAIGIARVRVRSQLKRADAHRFYTRDGYKQVKVSAVFEKQISGFRDGPHESSQNDEQTRA